MEPTPNLQLGFGDTVEELDGYDFKASVFEPNYKANCNFWNEIKRSKEWKFFYKTETQVHLTDSILTIVQLTFITDDRKVGVIFYQHLELIQTS